VLPRFSAPLPSAQYEAAIAQFFPYYNVTAAQVAAMYPCTQPADCRPQLVAAVGDAWLTCPTTILAMSFAEGQGHVDSGVFTYEFRHRPTWDPPAYGVQHASEIAFVYSNLATCSYPATADEVQCLRGCALSCVPACSSCVWVGILDRRAWPRT